MELPLTALHLDYHIPELSIPAFGRFDMAHYLEQLRRSDAEAVTLFAKDHFGNSFYPTRAGHRHRDLPCDLLGTAAAELRKAGKRVLAYYSLCWEKRGGRPAPGMAAARRGKPSVRSGRPVGNRLREFSVYGGTGSAAAA